MKIVGDNVTEKDYDDFWNAFHEESTGEKLNWAANQMQPQPQKQTAPQNRRSQNMMKWAMRERENLTPPQNTELTSELRDIEAAEKGDSNSEWFKRLEDAWNSGDLDTYEAVEREMKAQKDRINYILKNRERTYDDNFFGQFGANYRAGRMSQDEALAWNEYYKNPTKENRAYAESISDTLAYFRGNNAATLATMTAAPAIIGAEGYKTYSDLPDVQVEADAAGEIDAKSSFTRDILLSRAKNPKVINAVKQLYRPGAYTGDGGTAAAIRNEISTGLPTNGKSHIQKGQDWLRALTKIRSNESLTQDESIMLDELIDDLQRALKGE